MTSLSRRDQFALAAMQALVDGKENFAPVDVVEYADAIIAELDRKEKKEIKNDRVEHALVIGTGRNDIPECTICGEKFFGEVMERYCPGKKGEPSK